MPQVLHAITQRVQAVAGHILVRCAIFGQLQDGGYSSVTHAFYKPAGLPLGTACLAAIEPLHSETFGLLRF